MGFSLTASAAIIGVALVISIELIVSTSIPTVTDVHDSYDEMTDRSIEKLQTEINITNIVTSPNASLHDLSFEVKNKGSSTLDTNYFTVLINGTSKEFTSTTRYIYPESSTDFSVSAIGNSTNRIKVVTSNGISDYYEYTVP